MTEGTADRTTERIDRYARELRALQPDWLPENFSERVRVQEDRVLVLGDAHIPYHDVDLLAEALDFAREARVEAIVWLGDLMDMPTFSSWGTDDLTTLYRRELELTRGVIELASEVVSRQYWSSGNHEMRLMRRNGYQFGMEELALMAGLQDLLSTGQLITSDNPTLDYSSDGHDWMLTHPASYGGQPLVVPGRVADRYQVNVISAHAHHWAQGRSPSGRYTVIESGGLFKAEYIKYVQHRITDHRAWTQGYVALNHGQAHLCAPRRRRA